MSAEKMREEFEAAYVEALVARCGEGFRSTAVYSLSELRPDGEYLHYPDFIAWWAWQASRAAIEVVMPKGSVYPAGEAASEADYYFDQGQADGLRKARNAIESFGLKVKQ